MGEGGGGSTKSHRSPWSVSFCLSRMKGPNSNKRGINIDMKPAGCGSKIQMWSETANAIEQFLEDFQRSSNRRKYLRTDIGTFQQLVQLEAFEAATVPQ